MKRINRRLWNIVPPTVRGKVGRLWGDKGATEAYLGELYQSTLDSRETIRKAVVATEGSSGWGTLGWRLTRTWPASILSQLGASVVLTT